MTEREMFEEWAVDHRYSLRKLYRMRSRATYVQTDQYAEERTDAAWHAWQGRARIGKVNGQREPD